MQMLKFKRQLLKDIGNHYQSLAPKIPSFLLMCIAELHCF